RRLTFGVWAGAAVVLAALVVGAFAAYHKFRAPEGGPGPEPAAGAAAAAPIRIGILFSLTGTLAVSERPIVDAAQLAVDEVNEAGGVLGRKLEGVTEDGHSDEQVFAERARKLLTEDGVVTIVGCWTSGSRKRVAEVCRAHDRLLLYPTPYEGLE